MGLVSDRLHYESGGPVVPAEAIQAFATSAFVAVGVPDNDARFVATTLVHADLRGVHSHGLRMVTQYVEWIENGTTNPDPHIQSERDSSGAAVLAGDRSLGQIGARAGMESAINLARDRGIGVAAVSNTGHFGAAAYWVLQAAHEGLIGFATSNMTGACMLAHGSREPAVGNTPLAWAFPTHGTHPVVLDMAAGAYALNKLHLIAQVAEQLPEGIAADSDGNPTTDPSKLRYVLPAGGAKGYGLALTHDLISGCLSGDGSTLLKGAFEGATLGPRGSLFFMAIDVNVFLPLADFRTAMDQQTKAVNALSPADGFERVQMPGQPEWVTYESRINAGIPYPSGILEQLEPIADRHAITAPWRS